VRVAYVVVALVAFGLSMLTADLFFIASSGFILVGALLSAFIVTRRERRLASLIREASQLSTHQGAGEGRSSSSG
jgi:hypothetical protein